MIEEAGEKIHEQLRLVWKKFLAAFPVICFFLFEGVKFSVSMGKILL